MGLSTHILDTALGKPVSNIAVELSQWEDNVGGGSWNRIGSGRTDIDGRCKTLLGDHPLQPLDYKLTFWTGVYFRDLKQKALHPYIDIVFTVTDPAQHYHIPLLLTANGYTTYRGS